MRSDAWKDDRKFSSNWERPFRIANIAAGGAYHLEFLSRKNVPRVRLTTSTLSSSGDIPICTPCATWRRGLSIEGNREDHLASAIFWTALVEQPLFRFTGGTMVVGGITSIGTVRFPFPTISKVLIFLLDA